MSVTYKFSAELWLYPGESPWFFITVPQQYTEEIGLITADVKRGFGSVRVIAKTGKSEWKTSIFPDKNSGSYLLPIKKEIRQANDLKDGDIIQVVITIDEAK